MKIKFVYGILPALVFYANWVNEGFAGMSYAMVVRIRPQYVADEGLLQHELTHVKQMYRLLFFIHGLLYLCSDSYRLAAEVEAYKKQLEYSADKDADRTLFASFVCTRYGLSVDQQAVECMLREA